MIRPVLVLSENWTIVDPRDLRRLVDMAVEAEQAGFDAVMVSEHVVLGRGADAGGRPRNERDYALPGNQDPSTPWPSSLVVLSAVAARTSVLRLVAGALIAPLRHPLVLAQELAALDLLSRGRVIVQPTVSWHRAEYEALGVPFERRGEILDEQLQVWRTVWTRSSSSFHGTHVRFDDIHLEPKPHRDSGVRMWFGGEHLHPALRRRLTAYGHGFHPLGAPTDAELATVRADWAEARPDERLELIGGVRGEFTDATGVADLDAALRAIPALVARGFTTICIKPSMFLADGGGFARWCEQTARRMQDAAA